MFKKIQENIQETRKQYGLTPSSDLILNTQYAVSALRVGGLKINNDTEERFPLHMLGIRYNGINDLARQLNAIIKSVQNTLEANGLPLDTIIKVFYESTEDMPDGTKAGVFKFGIPLKLENENNPKPINVTILAQ